MDIVFVDGREGIYYWSQRLASPFVCLDLSSPWICCSNVGYNEAAQLRVKSADLH